MILIPMSPHATYLMESDPYGEVNHAADSILFANILLGIFHFGVNMATQFKIRVVNALPATYEPTTMYVVKSADTMHMELYVSDAQGANVRHILNQSEVQDMINSAISTALGQYNTAIVVGTIAERDARSPNTNEVVLVLDASGDPTVESGAATYIYNTADQTWHKISEAESMDLVLRWENVVGRPTSAVADIDDAVAKRHVHANKAVLDDIGDKDGFLSYKGSYVGVIDTPEW